MLTHWAEAPAVLIFPYRLYDPVNDLFHALLLIRGSRNMRGRLVEVYGLFRLDFPLFSFLYGFCGHWLPRMVLLSLLLCPINTPQKKCRIRAGLRTFAGNFILTQPKEQSASMHRSRKGLDCRLRLRAGGQAVARQDRAKNLNYMV